MKVAELIYHKLHQHGVKTVFGYSGGAIMPLLDHFHYTKNIHKMDLIVNTTEQCCGHAATAYSRALSCPGIVLVTSGPGITNLITPLLDANNDSTPLICISANVGKDSIGTNAFQEAPAIEITTSITKWNALVNSPSDIQSIIDYAFYIAMDGKRGSVHIDIPKCVLNSMYELPHAPNNSGPDMTIPITPFKPSKPMNVFAEIINNSLKPVLYVGQGSKHISNEIKYLSQQYSIPVTTTLHGMGIVDETNDLSLEMCGMHGSASANYAIQTADCIIAVGSRFDDRTTGSISKYAPKCKHVIHFNIESTEINKVIHTDNYVIGNVKYTIPKLITELTKLDTKNHIRVKWLAQIKRWKTEYPFKYIETTQLKTQEVLLILNQLITNEMHRVMITTGVGNHQMMACQFIKWKYPNMFISSGSLGVMGSGLPYSIGCQLGYPSRTIINLDGDSSFLMTCSDLKTIRTHNLPIKIIIFNNKSQDMVRVWEELFYDNRITATKNEYNPSFSKLAESFDIKGIQATKQNINEQLEYFMNYKGPILLECLTVSDYCFPLVPPGAGLDEMIFDNQPVTTGNAPS
jgi:acetolactate synthase-1/2/3 large subunit